MPSGICPNCGSNNITKEIIRGCKTGDYLCMDCKQADFPAAFKKALDEKENNHKKNIKEK